MQPGQLGLLLLLAATLGRCLVGHRRHLALLGHPREDRLVPHPGCRLVGCLRRVGCRLVGFLRRVGRHLGCLVARPHRPHCYLVGCSLVPLILQRSGAGLVWGRHALLAYRACTLSPLCCPLVQSRYLPLSTIM